MLLQRLREDESVGTIQLRVAGADWFQLIYRRDLDGTIEFSPVGTGTTSKQSRSIARRMSLAGCTRPALTHLWWLNTIGAQRILKIGRGLWRGSGEVDRQATDIAR